MIAVLTVLCFFAIGVAVLALHRNAVLGNEVGKLCVVTFSMQKRIDKLEAAKNE